jgi:hypothetical protein
VRQEVAVADASGAIKIWKANEATEVRTLAGHRGNVNSVAFSADGSQFFAAAGEPALFGEIRQWNVADGKLVRVFEGHKDALYCVALSPDEIKGRNMWVVWTGGNDRFWDGLTTSTFGAFDLLKIVAYDPNKPIDRAERWKRLGLINEPCMDAPAAPDPNRFGLMFDTRKAGCPADPFEDETRYPGVKVGARGSTVPSAKGAASGRRRSRAAIQPPFFCANSLASRTLPRGGMVRMISRVAA